MELDNIIESMTTSLTSSKAVLPTSFFNALLTTCLSVSINMLKQKALDLLMNPNSFRNLENYLLMTDSFVLQSNELYEKYLHYITFTSRYPTDIIKACQQALQQLATIPDFNEYKMGQQLGFLMGTSMKQLPKEQIIEFVKELLQLVNDSASLCLLSTIGFVAVFADDELVKARSNH